MAQATITKLFCDYCGKERRTYVRTEDTTSRERFHSAAGDTCCRQCDRTIVRACQYGSTGRDENQGEF